MTTPKPRRRTGEPRPTTFVDTAGIICVRVPLANTHDTAILWKDDYDRLKATGLSSYWFLGDNGNGLSYVRAKRPGMGLFAIGRLILQEHSSRTVVHYANGNRLDLRRSNLFTASNPYSYPESDAAKSELRA